MIEHPVDRSLQPIENCWNKIGVWGNSQCPELKKFVHCRNCPVYSTAAIQLLDRPLPPGYLDDWTSHFARPPKASEVKSQSVLLFRIASEWLAISALVLQEVAEVRKIHSLPHRRSPIVLGLVNIRGELLICVSLTETLSLQPDSNSLSSSKTTPKRFLVVKRGPSRFVFPIDEVYGIVEHDPHQLKDVPSTVAKAAGKFTRAVLNWQNKSVGCLDDELLFHSLDRSLS